MSAMRYTIAQTAPIVSGLQYISFADTQMITVYEHLRFSWLGHIFPLQPRLDESWAEPTDHAEGNCECNTGQCHRSHQRGAITLESVDKNADSSPNEN